MYFIPEPDKGCRSEFWRTYEECGCQGVIEEDDDATICPGCSVEGREETQPESAEHAGQVVEGCVHPKAQPREEQGEQDVEMGVARG